MEKKTFDRFRDLIYSHSGIALTEGKEALVSARIGRRIRALNLPDHEAYLDLISRPNAGEEMVQLLDAISTNVTSFYREPAHFSLLQEQIARWLDAGQKRIRIWCAASSTGEEPYTLAITLREAMAGRDVDAKILATDISTRVLAQAQAGRYDARKMTGMPPVLRERYFEKTKQDGETWYQATAELRGLITFSRLNLAKPPFPMHGPFDAVFCRNVMIYFDNVVRTRLLKEIFRLVRSGGFLMVGHSESLTGLVSEFKSIQPAVYVKP
ncbi:MAG: methyltransferase domain-containing protein [Planctomycetota bacterium]|nr:methyltransferase domain-containing protein [Planctomycetota bacterium]